MKKSILIALLAITVATKSYDQQIFIQKGDTVTLDLRDFFGAYTPKPFPDISNPFTLTTQTAQLEE